MRSSVESIVWGLAAGGSHGALLRRNPRARNPYVYDSAARDLKAMADKGLVRIVRESMRSGNFASLIERISFERIR